ncbi:MAG: 1-acyl-sn-glycerol-3-phosphate acyltransferase [Pedosphaera sp.]|nr:1-acyl-sn-glycerol-3-phosphate acyltransferase [Pedosphaera sp.]
MNLPPNMRLGYRFAWLLGRVACSTYFRWRVVQPERVPATGGVVLATNHASYFDPVFVGSALPRPLYYLSRYTAFEFPLGNTLRRLLNIVPVDLQSGTGRGLRTILNHLDAGAAVLVFPEGTRTYDGQLQSPKSGIGLMIIKSKVPVVPACIVGNYDAYGRHRRFPLPRRVVVKFGPPMNFNDERARAQSAPKEELREIYQSVATQMMEAIARLQSEPNS